MKIGLIVERCQIEEPDAFLAQVAALLREWGAVVKPIIPEAGYFRVTHIQPTADLYLLASDTPLALSLAGMLHSLGAALVNPYPVVNALHNKLIKLRILQAHGLPVPETYVTSNPAQLKELLAFGPLLIHPEHPPQTDTARPNEHLVYTMRDLLTATTPHSPIIAQRSFQPAARQWMLYSIGGHLLGVDPRQQEQRSFRNHFSLSPAAGWGTTRAGHHRDLRYEEVESSPADELAELVLRCGQAFDTDLFGIKVVEQQGVLYVLDMVSLPACNAPPEAAPRLAEYLYARTQFLIEQKRESWP